MAYTNLRVVWVLKQICVLCNPVIKRISYTVIPIPMQWLSGKFTDCDALWRNRATTDASLGNSCWVADKEEGRLPVRSSSLVK